jgi:hypothetical protein|tara:strand:- start:447 stop:680 length:234 start_codon:yes stop_codon:yes gene_type:complete
MITNLILNADTNLFVWLSFIITIFACSIVYLKTKRTLKKYENDFSAELEKLSVAERKAFLERSKIANQILVSQNKTI